MSELTIRQRAVALVQNGKWGRWINRGGWTLIDRALFAMSNFVLNVVLARWMSAEAYGAFAIAFSTFLIIGAAQSTMVSGPLLVFGPRRYRDRYPSYLGLVIKGQLVLSSLISVGLAAAGAVFLWHGSRDTGMVLLALAVAGPFILLMWLLRSSGYVQLQSRNAAINGAVYLVLVMAGTYLFYRLRILSPSAALGLMAVASLLVAILMAIRQKADLRGESLRGSFAREVLLEHWRYARWMLPARLLMATRNNIFFFVLPIWGGLEATGALRALLNLTMPIGFMQHSLEVILVPLLSRARSSKTLGEKIAVALGMFILNALVYGAILILFQDLIVDLLYRDRYDAYTGLVGLLALLPVINAVSIVLGCALTAMEQPKAVFWATLAAAICAIVVGLPAIWLWGVVGAGIGLVASATLVMLTMIYLMRSAWRRESAQQPV